MKGKGTIRIQINSFIYNEIMLFSDTDSSCCMHFSYLVICSLVDQNFHTNHRTQNDNYNVSSFTSV